MNKRNHFTAFLILLLLVSTFVAAPHYHADIADHHDCSVCVVSNHQPGTSQSALVFDGIPCFTETTVVVPSPVFPSNILISFLSNRAPPA